MKKKWWQVLLSYITDVHLESTGSEYNEQLDVILKDGRFQLCTSNAIYSFEDKYHNFRKCFELLDWPRVKVKKVLVLGLGLGSVPQMLEKVFLKKFEYHLVEIDEAVIELAHRYILGSLHSGMQIFNTDALIYLKLCREKYDMIILDIFEDNIVPAPFETHEVLEDISKLLKKTGFLLFNRINTTESDEVETNHYFVEIFKAQFPDAINLELPTNFMLCSRKDIFKELD